MKIKNKTSQGWQELYPETLAKNVKLLNGQNLEEFKEEVEDRLPDDVPLWEGNELMLEDKKIYPSKKLSDCNQGWVLRWQNANDDGITNSNFNYMYVPKVHLTSSGTGVKGIMGGISQKIISKYVYVRDGEIEGHSTNIEEDNTKLALT